MLPTKDKIKELQSFPYPRSLCRSLGMTGFYCKLCIHYLLLSEYMRLFPKSSFELTEAAKCTKQFCAECTVCLQSKVQRHTKSTIQNFELLFSCFQAVYIDTVRPLPPVHNNSNPYLSLYRYLLTCIDCATCWIEVQPLTEITVQLIAKAFIDIWIARFGVPLYIITNRGKQFQYR